MELKKLAVQELYVLTELFDYNNVEQMISECTHDIQNGREYPKVCVNLQTDVRYNYSVWRLFLWQEEKTAHKKQQ